MHRWIRITLFLAGFCAYNAQAQTYPDRSVRIMVGFAPGGAADVLSRTIGCELTRRWNQPVVADNLAARAA